MLVMINIDEIHWSSVAKACPNEANSIYPHKEIVILLLKAK
jgi:hypothetical protein